MIPPVSAAEILQRPPRRRMTLRRGLLAAFALMLALGATSWFERGPVLRTLAEWWVVSDPVGPADAVAVFGGGLEDRPFAAAEFYQRGLVRKILISSAHEGRVERLGVLPPHAEANRAVLLKLGVPAEAIEIFGSDLSNTHQEVLALHEWAARTGAHSIIVPTEIFAARRVRWMLHRVFDDATNIRVPAIEPAEYHGSDWWRDESGLLRFQNEILKYVYYLLKY
jgi:uncharacterized SAM-binding protein YcdF (DUF218 family)